MRHKYSLSLCVALIGATSAFGQSPTLNTLPSRVLGHPNAEQLSNVVSASPNLVEGRELYLPQGVALDTSVTPPIVYVADTYNNRVLAWKNATSFTNGVMADMVIGQNDFYSTRVQGPAGLNLVTGFYAPSGLAVDKGGNLYVVDGGNNRILRFPQPFAQTKSPVVPDLVIGQPNFTSRGTNYGATAGQSFSAQGIATASGSTVYTAGLAFDSSSNLWFTDVGNARVLRYPAASIPAANVANSNGGIAADLVIGQPSLTTAYTTKLSALTTPMLIKNQFGALATLGFDSAGHLFVVDDYADGTTSLGRVLVFASPNSLASGSGSADRVMGVVTADEIKAQGLTGPALATFDLQTWFYSPAGVFFLPGDYVGVVDTGNNRLMIFPPYSQWPAETANYSPLASSVVGQGANNNFLGTAANATTIAVTTSSASAVTPPASGSTFWGPAAAVYLSSPGELFVADEFNNRVVVLPYSGGTLGTATQVLGQTALNLNSPNYIEGREFQFVTSSTADAGIALDTTGSVPHLYISDPYNNRVLGYYDARSVKAGQRADLVIGQPNFNTAICNYNASSAVNQVGGDPTKPTQSSLCIPTGLAVDGGGNLYVADSANGRVMRFASPFLNWPKVATLQGADLVLGQNGFTAQIKQASNYGMYSPYGVAFSGKNGLLVSDAYLNRVLYIPFTSNGSFVAGTDNGKAATKVYGQSDFVSRTAGTGAGNLNTPLHVASDGEGRVYVADAGNNRISIFTDPNSPTTSVTGAAAFQTITGLSAPRGVWVNPNTDEIWIANTNGSTGSNVYMYPQVNLLYAGETPSVTLTTVSNALALVTDQPGALYVADATNRIAIYYPSMQSMNGASFLPSRSLAPGMIASLCSFGSNCVGGSSVFGSQTVTNSQIPVPTTLGDVQVSVNGTTAPLFYVSPAQINFQVPASTSTSAAALIEVSQKSTGQVLAAGQASMASVSPGIFQLAFTGTSRQAAVLNEDNSVNSATNPAQRGHLIQIYATGQGVYSNWPADGNPPTSTTVVPKGLTQVLINTCLLSEGTTAVGTNCGGQTGDVGQSGSVSSSWIPFSGLSPQFPGLWQINAQIPMATPPGQAVNLKVLINGTPSTDTVGSSYQTVVYIK